MLLRMATRVGGLLIPRRNLWANRPAAYTLERFVNFPFLDGFRGMLAIWVFVYHATHFAGGSLDIIPPGAAAVDLFMMVSGFLMAGNYHARIKVEPWESSRTWLIFYTRRFFRIAPLYYIALFVALLLANQYSFYSDFVARAFPPPWIEKLTFDPPHREFSILDTLLHISFLFGFVPSHASNNVLPDWSLALEMQFYAAFPFVILFMRRFGFLPLAALSVTLFVASKLLIGVYLAEPKLFGTFPQPSLLPLKLNCFMVGILIAEAHYCPKPKMVDGLLATALGLAFLRQNYYFSVLAVVFMLLVMTPIWKPPVIAKTIVEYLSLFFSSRVARHIGDISYGVYLLHMLVLLPVAYWLTTQGWYVQQTAATRSIMLSVVAFVPIYLASLASHMLIEQPFIAYGREVVKRERNSLGVAH